MSIDAVVVAGGSGTRIGGDIKKQFLELDGVPVILRTLHVFTALPEVRNIVLVVPVDELDNAIALLNRHKMSRVICVAGGVRRQDSVFNGLTAVPDASYVLIHDGVRPFVTATTLQRLLSESKLHDAVICAVPVTDTIKEVDANGKVIQTIPRSALRAVQTPQIFRYATLKAIMEECVAYDVTDEAAFFELKGLPVYCIMGEADNIKITIPQDLQRAHDILRHRENDV